MAFDYRIFWTEEAINNLEVIIDYLRNNWTQRELDNFNKRLSTQIRLIQQNPNLFPVSKYNSRLRHAVLSKQTSILYEVSGQIIYLAYLFNTKRDIEGIK